MKRSGTLAGILFLLAMVSSTLAEAQWARTNQAPDPFVRNIRVFSNTPASGQTTIFVASQANGMTKVVDSGASQTVTAMNSGLPVLRIRAVAAADIGTLYVGMDGHGVYKSTDGGANWVAANGTGVSALGCREVRNISVRTSTEVWAVTACRHGSGVYRTLDGGTTWTRHGVGVIPDDAAVGSAVFSGTGPGTIVVVVTARDGIFRSPDNGTTWAQINNGLPAPNGANRISVFNVIFLATSNAMLAYVEGHGMYRTLDSGANWSAFGTGFPSTARALGGIQRQSATQAFIGTDKGPVYQTTDGGATWSPWGNTGTNDVGQFVRSVAFDASGRIYLSGQIGLGRTTDNANTFLFIPTGEGYTGSMVLDPDGKTFYLTSHSVIRFPNLYAPIDAPGNAGADIGTGLPGSMVSGSIAQDKSQPATLYAAVTNFGLYKTSNGGGTWSKLPLPNVEVGTTPFVNISPSNGQVLYGSPGNKYGTLAGGGLYKSLDGGSTWADSSSGLLTAEARDVNSIALHQDAPSAIVIATEDGLYRSTDAGATWAPVLQITDDQSTRLSWSSVRFHPFDPTILYAAANHTNADSSVRASSGVWKSVNGGATWTQVLSGKRATSVRVEGDGRVFAMLSRDLSQPAIVASSDGGVNWPAFNGGIADNDGVTITTSTREQGGKVVFSSMTTGMYVLDQRPTRLLGISTRAQVQTGNDIMIGGFIIGGSTPKKVIVYARGPSLEAQGVPNVLADPTLTLVQGGAVIATNDNWQAAPNAAEIVSLALQPSNVLESAILMTLNPGAYTALVSGLNGLTGVGIVEVYEVDGPTLPLVGISTRGQVRTGNDVMIGGFIISGTTPQTVVVKARGPSVGVPGSLADPTLTLVQGGVVIATNNNWQTDPNAGALAASGGAPPDARESAILITLNPGAYTAILSGVDGGTGVGIIEVYAQ